MGFPTHKEDHVTEPESLTRPGAADEAALSSPTFAPKPDRKPLGKAESAALKGLLIGLLLGLAAGFLIWGLSSATENQGGGSASGDVSIDNLIAEGLALQQAGQTTQAEAKFNEVLDRDESNQFANYNIGVIKQTSGDPAGSINFYRRALEADPTFNSARYNLALALRDTGHQAGAIAELELVLLADPNGVGTLINLGNLLIESGDLTRAAAHRPGKRDLWRHALDRGQQWLSGLRPCDLSSVDPY